MSFTFMLKYEDGSPADPPTLRTAVPTWGPGDTIPLGNERSLRVIDICEEETPEGDAVLVVELD